MRNLLSAGFARLWRCKVFWLSCVFVAAATISTVWTRYAERVEYTYSSNLDTAFQYYVLFSVFLIPVVCALFIGVEYADGTIRNKMVCGHSRAAVYLSNLILCSVGSLIMCTAGMVPGLALGLPLLGGFDMGPARAFLFFIGVYTLSLAWAALFTLLAMLVSSRTVSVVAAMLISLALLAAGAYLEGRLEAPPSFPAYTVTVSGEVVEGEEWPNPAYVPDGPVRNTIQFLSDFTPGGQTLQHIEQRAKQPEKLMAYDAVLFVLSTAAGLFLFRRKDLK